MSKSNYIRNLEELSNILRAIREDRDISQQAVADALNIDRSTYTYYETGKTLPDIFKLIKLSEFYKLDIKIFLMRSAYFNLLL